MPLYYLTLLLWSWLASDSVSCIQTWFYWSEQYETWTVCTLLPGDSKACEGLY